MRRIGWAIALAAAWLIPAAAPAQPANAPAPAQTSAAAPVGTPPAGTAQNPGKPDAAQPAVVPGTTGHMTPTPGIGQPDGRKGIQDQVTPIGEEAASFHNGPLMIVAVAISILVLALLL